MDRKINQEESPENRPNFRCQDETVFIYAKERGLYEPYEKSKEDRDKAGAAERQKSRNPFVKYWGQPMRFWVTTLISLAGVIVVGIYTHYAREQWCATVQAVKEAHASVTNAENAMELDERAWVTVFDLKQSGSDSFSLVIINTGRTPARNFKIAAGSDIGDKRGDEQPLLGEGVIAPEGKFSTFMHADGAIPQSVRLAIHGRVSYDSIFGGQHWTIFCYVLTPRQGQVPAGFRPCDSGNEIDRNPH